MKIALQHGQIILAEIEPLRYEQLKRMGIFRRNKTTRTMTGPVSLDALNALHNRFTLPDFVETERERLAEVASQVEQQREGKEPKPLAAYPVRAQMFQHQIRGANMALLQLTSGGKEQHKGFGFLFEMGCGKTLTAIATMGALYQQHRIERVLVVAPTSVCSVWPHDLQQFAAFPYHCETLLGEKKKRLEGLDALEVWPFASLKIAVINYESTHRDGIFDALVEYDADLIICDESQRIKNHSAAQSKALHKLGDKARYKLALSGTPVQNNAVDLYSQYRFLDSAVFGSNFFAFRNRYCVMGGYGQHQIVGYQHMEQLMANCITAGIQEQEQPDVNEQAAQYISDWISANTNSFTDTNAIGQRYGSIEDSTAFILPTILREALEKGGFSYRKTMNWLAENDIIQIDPHGKYQVVRWFGNRSVRMIAIDMEALQNPPDPAGFREITDKDDLPF